MTAYTKTSELKGLLSFIDASPTPYHAVETLAGMVTDAGAVELCEDERWDKLEPGRLYYLVRNESCIVAVRPGTASPAESGWRITLSHIDYPCLRVRPNPTNMANSYERVNAEVYGGVIHHSWFDRPLKLAGRVYVKVHDNVSGSNGLNGLRGLNYNASRPLFTIPELAIHMNHGVNDGARFNPQTEMFPLFSQDFENKKQFLSFLAAELDVDEADIMSYDLSVCDAEPACTVGRNNEFVSAPHLDDGAMAYSTFRGLIETAAHGSTAQNLLAIAYDHEEIGSTSDRGARSSLLTSILARLHDNLGFSEENKQRALARSLICSADMAHASHPSYPGTYDAEHQIQLNKGPVLKHSAVQSYIDSPKADAFFRLLCEAHNIPYQEFVNRNDLRGGSTVGPVSSANIGASGFDIGTPIFSMHSVRELGGADDVFHATRFFEAFDS